MSRLGKMHATGEGEFAIPASDIYDHRGLGVELLNSLLEIGRQDRLPQIYSDVLTGNRDSLRICDTLSPRLNCLAEFRIVRALINL